ncbi:MAG: hypothetical protein E7408_03280 [Ruminococcaceae bacterium]|nr:hypothetical protein [Oscillospiraceae bacterium]
MAYKIGSEAGKKKANEMKAGEKWTNTTDGSTWEKKADGSVSVTTSKGEKFDNAYKPSAPSQATGGSSYNGASGGSPNKSTGYSQYTKPNLGSTWDANTDYQAIINEAVKNGDYVTAAKAEQFRNQKIIATGANYDQTTKYGGYAHGIDWGTVGRNQMANGASWQDVSETYNTRYGKAMGTEGLQQYANDETQQMMMQYILDNMPKSNQPEAWGDYDTTNPKPTAPKRDPRIDDLLNQILNRDDFSYDAASDPLYQQYAQMYRREGDRAMRDTLAEAAAGAGGMNTYAITAAQQANNYYNSQLNDKIPELYQLAYQMYLNDKEGMVQDLGILQNMDESQYNRYRDTINDWYSDKNFAYGLYRDAVQDGKWKTQFDYNAMIDNRNFIRDDIWANKEWNYQLGRDQINDSRYDDETSYNRGQDERKSAKETLWAIIDSGDMPRDELIVQAGMNKADVEQRVAARRAELGKTGASSGDGPRRYPGTDDMFDYTITNGHAEDWVAVAGYGRLTYKELYNMVEKGTVKEIVDNQNKKISYRKA